MKRNHHHLLRYTVTAFLLITFLSFHSILTVQGEQSEPKFVLLRLEDVGPGGQYETLDQLGKLRAVFDYLKTAGVRYQVGVIPRWINYSPDKTVYNNQLDRLDDPYIEAFDRVLHEARAGGGTVGMHGYTHQVGDSRREDGQQESGIGNEFNVAGLPDTATPAFARERVEEGLAILKKAGIRPDFWEAPHYHTADAQQAVFRSYFGITYENELADPNQPFAVYETAANTGYGSASLGAVYVPTPFSFIPYNRDEKLILNQLALKKLPSFFYHAFLEFRYLYPVLDEEGNPVLRDGIPEYRYPDKDKTNLQKLVAGLSEKGYSFYSLQDYIPFTPAHRVSLEGARESEVKLGDVTGDGQGDTVVWNASDGNVTVAAGDYRGMRNDPQPARVEWLRLSREKGDRFVLFDQDGDGRQDLGVVRAAGRFELYRSKGDRFELSRSWIVSPGAEWSEPFALKQPDGWVVAGASKDQSSLLGLYLHAGKADPIAPLKWKTNAAKRLQVSRQNASADTIWLAKKDTDTGIRIAFAREGLKWTTEKAALGLSADLGDQYLGDYNGDGREDVLLWDRTNRTGMVFLRTPEGGFQYVSRFGPWGLPNSRLAVTDCDGNGKSDLVSYDPAGSSFDLALSYQRLQPGLH